jgi:hypothetical protein
MTTSEEKNYLIRICTDDILPRRAQSMFCEQNLYHQGEQKHQRRIDLEEYLFPLTGFRKANIQNTVTLVLKTNGVRATKDNNLAHVL